MSPAEFEQRMRAIYADSNYDEEGMHADADELMEQALTEAGFGAGIAVLEDKTRWYA